MQLLRYSDFLCVQIASTEPAQVVPVLLALTRSADDLQRRIDMVRALTDLVVLMRQHIRKFLPDFLALTRELWGMVPAMLPQVLTLLAELSRECDRPASIIPFPSSARHHFSSIVQSTKYLYYIVYLWSAETLRDDFRTFMPDLLPKFVALFNDADRTSDFTMARN